MQLNWLLIFEGATRRGGARRDPFQDPLERPEWRDANWANRMIPWLLAEREARQTPVQRPLLPINISNWITIIRSLARRRRMSRSSSG